ncbi:MAG: D-alanine--D-alanine ligase family protein [Acidimicrobiales bacterium]
MASADRIRLVLLFGGRSAEHEVSCISALHVLRAIDPTRFEVVPIGVTREGRWLSAAESVAALPAAAPSLPSPDDEPGPELDPMPALLPGTREGAGAPVVAFPLIHGPTGEDGTIQGLLETAGVPYVGAGVAASALCMDKGLAKRVLEASGLSLGRWLGLRGSEVTPGLAQRVGETLGYPVFVKPANLGSSVGVTRATDGPGLEEAIELALRYDEYVVIEEAIAGREIEVAVLGNEFPRASLPGEIRPSHAFYDFEDKYLEDGAGLLVPAPLEAAQVEEVRSLALAAYRALQVDGMARVDFFLEEGGRGFLINELNTIPGFTPISMYARLWKETGIDYPQLVEELVKLALDRYSRRSGFETVRK